MTQTVKDLMIPYSPPAPMPGQADDFEVELIAVKLPQPPGGVLRCSNRPCL